MQFRGTRSRRQLQVCCLLIAVCLFVYLSRGTTQPKKSGCICRGRRCGCNPPTDKLELTTDVTVIQQRPPGFEKWEAFAKENSCHLGPYRRIEADLQRFRDPNNKHKRTISKASIRQAGILHHTHFCTIVNGTLRSDPGWWAAGQLQQTLARVAKLLPDMEFVVNKLDEPRVLVGDIMDIDARLASEECRNASLAFKQFGHLHGSINSRNTESGRIPTNRLLPVFSQSKINGCFADLTVPDWTAWDNVIKPEKQPDLPPWHDRRDVLFFRGSSTGGHYYQGVDFTRSHRQRLVAFARGKPHVNVTLSAITQCADAKTCRDMEEYFTAQGTLQPRVDQRESFHNKYLLVIDGNTFISRLPLFLSSGSLVFRAALYSQWFDEWLVPGQNYLEVKFDLSDLESQLEWALRHDTEAKLIAEQGRQFALTRLRNEDVECYWARLLLEYAALVE